MCEYPFVYAEMLKALGREDEVKGFLDYGHMTEYIEYILKPYYASIEDSLHFG